MDAASRRQAILDRLRAADRPVSASSLAAEQNVSRQIIVEHPVYGQLTGQLQISSRYDVQQFLARVQAHDAAPLSMLTGGIHLHTLRCPDEAACARACAALKAAGLLLDD